MQDSSPVKINLSAWPWATVLALLLTAALGVTHVIDQTKLGFDEYITSVTYLWSLLAIGRGFALKEQETVEISPIDRFLNTFPWATAVVGVVAVVGYVGVLIGDSMTITELGAKLAILVGALGVGRGLGVGKQQIVAGQLGTNIAYSYPAAPTISEEDMRKLAQQLEFPVDQPLSTTVRAQDVDAEVGAQDEPPVKGSTSTLPGDAT